MRIIELENRCTGNRTVCFESHPLRQRSLNDNSSTVMTRPNPHLSTHLKILGRGSGEKQQPEHLFDRSFSRLGSGQQGAISSTVGLAPPWTRPVLFFWALICLSSHCLLMRGGTPGRLNHPTRLRGLTFGIRTGHRADQSSGAASELPFWGRSV
jgi:hypothetical protein